jgi:GNAT superfamily N-acetyltransferase
MDKQSFEKKNFIKIDIRECKTNEEIISTSCVMRQLRPHISESEYCHQILSLIQKENFRLFAAYDRSNQCIGAVGFQLQNRLSLGKIIYIADLVTDENHRSQGIGSQLINFVKQEADQQQIDAIVLDSGLQRKQAHKFYEQHGYKAVSYSFRLIKDLPSNVNRLI